MTYNFDPDRWYDNERTALDLRHRQGKIDDRWYAVELKALNRRYEKMLDRLDGTYRLPESET